MASHKYALHAHNYVIHTDTYNENENLGNFYNILATDTHVDKTPNQTADFEYDLEKHDSHQKMRAHSGKVDTFAVAVEAWDYPIYGTMYHPETQTMVLWGDDLAAKKGKIYNDDTD